MSGKNLDVRRVLPVRYIIWRFFTGQHLDGYRRTNGTFLYRGTRPLGGIVKASNWAYRPGYQRLLIRLAWLLGMFTTPVGLLFWPRATKVVIGALVCGTVGYYLYRVIRRLARFQPSPEVDEASTPSSLRSDRDS